MRSALLLLALVLAGCSGAPDPLEGRWDVSDPEGAAKGQVTVGEFKAGTATFERRGEILGIGRVSIRTSGTYSVSNNEVTLMKDKSQIDASAIRDPKLRAQTVKVLEGIAQGSEGKPILYTLKADSPDRVVLSNQSGSLTLTRAR